EILSTLVHEMVHVWQYCFGKPTRGRYHNREWAAKMKSIGLQPSNTGKPGGKETGQHMTHYIVEGAYSASYDTLAHTGFRLSWNSHRAPIKRRESKLKYTCPKCEQNAWAKPEAALVCGYCELEMKSVAELVGVV